MVVFLGMNVGVRRIVMLTRAGVVNAHQIPRSDWCAIMMTLAVLGSYWRALWAWPPRVENRETLPCVVIVVRVIFIMLRHGYSAMLVL